MYQKNGINVRPATELNAATPLHVKLHGELPQGNSPKLICEANEQQLTKTSNNSYS
jgi:hypothetical protein